ncbi:HK97 family phage prohead protease [Clostridium sp. NSJ-6]|uniref:HK97 family phage prohead protease n=1 Tax=Clostridium hominis TaxID=2763036 RepID=A0ABR7DDF0_9CLOT|nr:HK97 family phage prohead protease [Clostridium hominis]MBC5628878.1 HK97 family phage prohead protease [Clostridium hominis]
MRIEIRNNSVILDGYVNAVDRESKPIPSVKGRFVEKIKPGAFQRSLERRANVDLLLNHNDKRKLGSTEEGNLELFEDNIGLRAICTITDSEVIEKAKNNQLRGWSFGFYAEKDHWETSENGYEKRTVEELDLFEVTIVDNTRNPAYSATSIEMRDDKEILTENRVIDFKAIIVDESKNKEERTNIDYSKYENEIESFKKS